MSELTPDAACDAIRALKGLSEWTQRRFAVYARKRFSRRKKLLAQLQADPQPSSKGAVVSSLIEHGFFQVLRMKVESDGLPVSGPAVNADDLYPCAGALIAPFIQDLEAVGALRSGATELAKQWRPQGLRPMGGALKAAFVQAFEAVGAPEELAGLLLPLLVGAVEGQPLLRFPSDDRSPKEELLRISGIVADLRLASDIADGRLFYRDDLMRQLLRRLGTREDFEQTLDAGLFAANAEQERVVDEAAHASTEALIACDPSSADDVEKVFSILGGHHSDDRVMLIAYGAFLREEADLIWGKPEQPA